ncbi:MAG: DEAD/DEAH box helicase [Bdellovibrio sp.]|nr:DEAD/DEAH box helicase [Bdellovibrio sp.]
MLNFDNLGLCESILLSIKAKGYTIPTPIQIQAIPHLMEGRDLLGIAQTGTGKTAAFALPLIDRLIKNRVKVRPARMRALILTPTRELAAQILANINIYGKNAKLTNTVMFGGVGERPQIMAMSRGVDILVATPGRLLDLMEQGHVRFEQLEVFILDEADRMLDMGFITDVKRVIQQLPARRQTLLFSATMPQDIASLASTILHKPVRVEVTPQSTTVEKVEQKVAMVEKGNRLMLLRNIVRQNSDGSVLVFTRTKHGADRVVKHLEREKVVAMAIHGNKSQTARERALHSFRSGKIKVLVATDIAARGIDVPGVGFVINYDLPEDPESYVHRIGRTARAGRGGIAISFCDNSELHLLRAVERLIKRKVPVDVTLKHQ